MQTESQAPLGYEYMTRRPWPRRTIVAVAVVVAVLLLAVASIPGGLVKRGMDPVTGTTYQHTVGPLGIEFGTRVGVSPLEKHMVARGMAWTPSCRWFGATGRTLIGRDTYRECGTPPAMSGISGCLGDLVATFSDDEIRAFVVAMQLGDDVQQKATVDAAVDRLYPNAN